MERGNVLMICELECACPTIGPARYIVLGMVWQLNGQFGMWCDNMHGGCNLIFDVYNDIK
jgi:hypothetical protein